MTADYTIEATPGQVAAYERDGFLVVAGPTISRREPLPSDGPDYHADHEAWRRGGSKTVPVPTTKPCPECGGDGQMQVTERWGPWRPGDTVVTDCDACNGEGTVPIVVEVVVPERPCDCGARWDRFGCRSHYTHCSKRLYPARTLLRGTAEAVPVVDDTNDIEQRECVIVNAHIILRRRDPARPTMWSFTDITRHFADVPRPEVGDTAWIIRGEGS